MEDVPQPERRPEEMTKEELLREYYALMTKWVLGEYKIVELEGKLRRAHNAIKSLIADDQDLGN